MTEHASRAAWVVIGVVFLALVALAFRPAELLAGRPLTEDGFYALAVARHVALGNGVTIDGVHLTNGFQPLFTLLCVPAYLLTGGDLVGSLRLVLLLHALVLGVTVVVVADLARRLAPDAQARAAGAWAALAYGGGAYLYFQHFNGLETGLELLLLALVARAFLVGEGTTTAGAARLGALLGLLVLARIDGALLVAGACLALLRGPGGLVRAVTTGAVAVAVSSPWWIYNKVGFGGFVPTSGTAQQAWGLDPSRFVEAGKAVMMALAPAVSLPGASPSLETPGFVALRGLLAVLLGLGVLRARLGSTWTPELTERVGRLALASAVAVVLGGVYYVGGSYATWHYPRYFAPLALPATVATGLALAAGPAWARAAALAVLPSLLLVAQVDLWTTGAWRHNRFHTDQLALVTAHVPADVRLAAWQSGTLGYFREDVVNLDGKVNLEAQRNKGHMPEYLAELGVTWLVDWPENVRVGLGLPPGVDPATLGWDKVAEQGGFAVYHKVR